VIEGRDRSVSFLTDDAIRCDAHMASVGRECCVSR